jgi:hypothetical protein
VKAILQALNNATKGMPLLNPAAFFYRLMKLHTPSQTGGSLGLHYYY